MTYNKGSINSNCYHHCYNPWDIRCQREIQRNLRNEEKHPGRLPFEMLDCQKKRICFLVSFQQNMSRGKELWARSLGDWILSALSFPDAPNHNWILSHMSLLTPPFRCPIPSSSHKFISHTHTAKSKTSNTSHTHTRAHTRTGTHMDIKPPLSSGSLNDLLELCLRESRAVTFKGRSVKVWFVPNRKIYFFQFHFCHTMTIVFPAGDSFSFCNNHHDDRSQATIWAAWVEWRLLVLWPPVQNGLAVSTAHLNEDGLDSCWWNHISPLPSFPS